MIITIESEILEIKNTIPKLSNLSEEYLFSLVCFKYFYNNGFLSYKDYVTCFVDGRADGGIDLISTIEDSVDQVSLNMIQSKYISVLSNYNDILDMIRKIVTTHNDFKNGNTTKYSSKLRQKFQDKLSEIEDISSTNTISIFIAAELSTNTRSKIEKAIPDIPYFDQYDINIFDRNQILQEIQSVLEPKRYVDEGKIRISKDNGKIEYGNNGILVNVYASSLKELYERFRDKGLFEQNFRYFVKNKKIDDNIKHSLSSKKNKFWFLNNGIIIGCKEFLYDSTNVKLYNFSIINGCQTTTLIGEFDGISQDNDFVLPCKIVKPEIDDDNLFDLFISEIAESSNSQKPISDRDLKSNMPEQLNLKRKLKESDPKVYIEIKRGEKKEKAFEKWQIISNDLYGQLILAFHFQQPGTARSFKKKIFGDENIYSKVFKRSIDKQNIVDLLKLHSYYESFINTKLSSLNFNNDYENVATNGKLIVLSIISFFIKLKRKLVDKDNLTKSLQYDNVKDNIFVYNLLDNYMETLEALYIEIIGELVDVYNKKIDVYKTVTNFFKLDKYYYDDIIPHFYNRYYLNPRKKQEMDKIIEELFE